MLFRLEPALGNRVDSISDCGELFASVLRTGWPMLPRQWHSLSSEALRTAEEGVETSKRHFGRPRALNTPFQSPPQEAV